MKMKVGLSLEEITVKRVHMLAAATRRDKSTIVDMAVELLSRQDEFQNLLVNLDPTSPEAEQTYVENVKRIKAKKPGKTSARLRKQSLDSIVGVHRGATKVA